MSRLKKTIMLLCLSIMIPFLLLIQNAYESDKETMRNSYQGKEEKTAEIYNTIKTLCEPIMEPDLTGPEKDVYNTILDSIYAFSQTTTLQISDDSEISKTRIIEIIGIIKENPELFWVKAIPGYKYKTENGIQTYTIKIEYQISKEQKNALEALLKFKLYDVVRNLNTQDIKTTSTSIIQYLADTTTYVKDATKRTGYPYDTILGPLLYKTAICSGYAKTYSYVMSVLGYPSAYCLGYVNGNQYHAWSAFKLQDEIYFSDPTFYATTGKRNDWINQPLSSWQGYREKIKYWYLPTLRFVAK